MKEHLSYDIEDFYQDIATFNYLKGLNDKVEYTPEVMTKLIHDQLLRIKEELDETFAAHADKDDIEILDGTVDILVTAIGLAQVLEQAGTDVMGACREVAHNNLDKYTTIREVAKTTATTYTDNGEPCEVFVAIEDGVDSIYGVRRLSDNKLMKPHKHPRVDLTKFIPGHEYEQ